MARTTEVIRLLGNVQNAHGSFKKGDVVEWPIEDTRPLIAGESAEKVAAEELEAGVKIKGSR